MIYAYCICRYILLISLSGIIILQDSYQILLFYTTKTKTTRSRSKIFFLFIRGTEYRERTGKRKFSNHSRGSEEKESSDLIECTSLNIEMTDKNFETADFTSSEKQVRFSMTTMKTPPNSPKPPNTRHSEEMDSRSTVSEKKVYLFFSHLVIKIQHNIIGTLATCKY